VMGTVGVVATTIMAHPRMVAVGMEDHPPEAAEVTVLRLGIAAARPLGGQGNYQYQLYPR